MGRVHDMVANGHDDICIGSLQHLREAFIYVLAAFVR